eukprot:1970110-Prymnesium_polylepis.1
MKDWLRRISWYVYPVMHDLIAAAKERRVDLAAVTRMAHKGDPALMAALEAAGIDSQARRE